MSEPADQFLNRVRSALGRAGPWRAEVRPPRAPEPLALPPGELLARFRSELEAIGGKVHCAAAADAPRLVAELAAARSVETFARWRTPFLDGIALAPALAARPPMRELTITDAVHAREELRSLDLGISDAELAIAETGSILLAPGPGRARLITCLPRMHIALLSVDRLRASLTEVPELLRESRAADGRYRSNLVIVTGPSRTADIENVLVVGIHGPVELHVLFIES